MVLSIITTLFHTISLAYGDCLPARETVYAPHEGHYHRIHPSGNYFIYSKDKNITLVDITDRKDPRYVVTKMREETYPVEAASGGWDLIASPIEGGSQGPKGGMEYYKFQDFIDQLNEGKTHQKPAFTDPNHGEFYHSTAELPGSTATSKKIRTLLYSNQAYREYDVKISPDGDVTSLNKSEVKFLCPDVLQKFNLPPKKRQEFYEESDKIQRPYLERIAELTKQKKHAEATLLTEELENALKPVRNKFYGPAYEELTKKDEALKAQYQKASEKLETSPDYKKIKTENEEAKQNLKAAELLIQNDTEIKEKVEILQKLVETPLPKDPEEVKKIKAFHEATAKEIQERVEKVSQELGYSEIQKAYEASEKKRKDFVKTSPLTRELDEIGKELQDVGSIIWAYKLQRPIQNPVLSKDGTHFAALIGSKVEVFKILPDGKCESVAKTDFRGSKVSFSYPKPGESLKITFTVEGGPTNDYKRTAYVYDLGSQTSKIISTPEDENPYYPGFTLDGRVIFKTDTGVSIVDPNQVNGNSGQCISDSKNSSPFKDRRKKPRTVR